MTRSCRGSRSSGSRCTGGPQSGRPGSRSTTRGSGGSCRSTRSPTPGRRPTSDGWVGETIGDAPWVLVGALTRDDFPLETLTALTARGHRLIVDAQGLVRHGRVGPLVSDGTVDRAVLGHITALKLNDEEAEQLCGGTDEAALRTLGIPEIVLTLGLRGSADHLADDIATHVDAVPVDGPVDPTGAGDSFLLAYAVARQRGAGPNEAGLIASRFVSTIIAR